MSRYSVSRQIMGLIGWLLLTFAAAAAGAVASASAGEFYQQLSRPAWAPPSWLFGPVWTVLYFLMALSAWLVWRDHGFRKARVALALFVGQLVINALWTWLFFAWRLGGLALAEIALLWIIIVGTIVAFFRLNKAAGALLIPYLMWVSFATALTYAMWTRNPGILV